MGEGICVLACGHCQICLCGLCNLACVISPRVGKWKKDPVFFSCFQLFSSWKQGRRPPWHLGVSPRLTGSRGVVWVCLHEQGTIPEHFLKQLSHNFVEDGDALLIWRKIWITSFQVHEHRHCINYLRHKDHNAKTGLACCDTTFHSNVCSTNAGGFI